ncbi:hypothetical protein ORV05_01845 [Amycolatopsis cynarae]|uniref:Lipoprotein n=1 Tax=Amycolatopsis cynarae TaxID=2995223 RepID=A0ABY7B6T1_9PSEU|nr:hypothetical protein [Amycolatopsis sp. HUAS 11-8]WAL66586.1 hypothetical protein ORV05_01845 [Amycolatopsis sp. HUAS 11-8]
MGYLLGFAAAMALTGCDAPSPPSGAEAAPATAAAVQSALATLADQVAIGYGLPSGALLYVTRNGLAQGSLTLNGQQVRVLRAGGRLFVSASADYWRAQGMPPDRAEGYGARWTRTSLGFDLGGSLNPTTVAHELGAGLTPDQQAARETLPDGTEILDVHGLRVTAAPPHRVVSVASGLLGPAVAQALGDLPVSVTVPSGPKLADMRAAFDATVDALGRPPVAGPSITATVTGNTLRCGSGGGCTDQVRVVNRSSGAEPGTAARIQLKTSVSSTELGTRSCGQELVVPVNSTVDLSCSVRFSLPRVSGTTTTTVTAVPEVSAEPVAILDPGALKHEVAAELGS